jgi:hypothetical protein
MGPVKRVLSGKNPFIPQNSPQVKEILNGRVREIDLKNKPRNHAKE